MRLPTRTTSLTGNKEQAFTFVEVMISLVILSAGIIMIYKSFFLCADYLSYLTCRLHASQMIESKIADITRSYRESSDATFERGATTETLQVNHKWIDFNYDIQMKPVLGMDYAWILDVGLSWHDGRRLMKVYRESLLTKI